MEQQDHIQAVGFAGLKIQEVQDALSSVALRLEEAEATMIRAVGPDPKVVTAQTALGGVLLIRNTLDDLSAVCEEIKGNLNAYGQFI